MLLSIAMMVKNEEKHLENCLKSLQPILNNIDSELIIVDTGSTDNTVEISKKFTDKLYFHQWNNDFSEMRNITISYTKGKWIFILDGDEVLENCNAIIEFFNSGNYKNYKTGSLTTKNFTETNDKNKYSTFDSLRLFKKSKNFKYQGAVHNQPIFEYPVIKINSTIQHYGYISDDKELMERKFNRTVNILKSELEKDPESIYYNYQLCISYGMHNNNKEALEQIIKAYELCKVSKEKVNHKYVYMIYCQMQLASNNLKLVEDVGEEALDLYSEDHIYKIDIYYYLYKAKVLLKKNKEALESLKHYLRLMDKYEKGLLPVDPSIINYTNVYKDSEFETLITLLFEEEEYKELIEKFNKADSIKIEKYLKIIIGAYLNLRDYEGLKNYYNKLIQEEQIEGIKLSDNIEELKFKLSEEIAEEIDKVFSKGNSDYEKLNNIRTFGKEQKIQEDLEEFFNSLDFNNLSNYYGDVIYHLIRSNYDVTSYINKISYGKLNSIIQYCIKRHKDFSKVVYYYVINKNADIYKFDEIKATVILCRYIILLHELEKEQEEELFKNYVELGKAYTKFIYSDFVLEEERIMEVKSDEDAFFMYLLKGDKYKEKDLGQYMRYLNKALSTYDLMKSGIETLLKEIEDEVDKKINYKNPELESLKDDFKNNIEKLIICGEFASAEELIRQYEEFAEIDLQLLLYKSQIETKKKTKEFLN